MFQAGACVQPNAPIRSAAGRTVAGTSAAIGAATKETVHVSNYASYGKR